MGLLGMSHFPSWLLPAPQQPGHSTFICPSPTPPPPTPKDDWNPNPKFFVGSLGKNEIRMGSFFGTFEKYRQRVQILSAPLNNKSEPPYSKTKVPGTLCYFPVLKLHPG